MIQITNLTKVYKSKKGTKVALDIPSLTLPDTGMIFISGKSGSGKSTFINLIGGLDNVTTGNIVVNGVDIAKLNETALTKYRSSITTYIFQDYYLLPQLNVYENINLLLSDEEKDSSRIDEIIERTGLKEHIHKKTNELSGGERQRVAIARALAKRPKILLCDEPTGNLDEENSDVVLSILKELSKEILIIVVSHKRYECETYGDTILYLSNGKVKGSSNDFLDNLPSSPLETKKIVQNKVPVSNTAKLFAAFLKNKVGSSVFMIVMIALLLGLFYVIQSFLSFNTNDAIKQSVLNEGQNTLQLLKVSPYQFSYTPHYSVCEFTDADIAEMKLKKSTAYKLYAFASPIADDSNYIMMDRMYYSTVPLPKNGMITGILCRETYGTLVCDDDYMLKQFAINGKIEVLAGSLNECRTTKKVAITDYVADSLMVYYNIASYEECLGYLPLSFAGRQVNHIQVGAIIKTDYKEKHKLLYDKYFNLSVIDEDDYSLPEFTALRKDYAYRLAITYSLNPNFKDYINDGTLTDKTSLAGFYFETFDENGEKTMSVDAGLSSYDRIIKSFNQEYDLADDEIIMYSSYYKALTGVNPPNEDHFSDPSYVIYAKLNFYKDYNRDGELLYSKTVKVVGVDMHWMRMSETLRKELVKFDVVPFATIFSDFNEISKVVNYYEQHEKSSMLNSVNIYSVSKITQIVTTFNDLFLIIGVLLVSILCILIISYSLKSITANEYEIGVMKAMGVQGGKLFVIFTVKLMIVVLIGIMLSFLIGLFLVPLCNKVLTRAVMGLSTAMDNVPTIINYTLDKYAYDSLIAIGLALAVSLVSLLFIKRIKPIKIIKTID